MPNALSFTIFLNEVNDNLVTFSCKQITRKDSLCTIIKMNRSESLDIYNMLNNMFKSIVCGITEPLALCMNCLPSDEFSYFLNIPRVCPIYKNCPRDQPQSYHQISVNPVI